MFWAHGFESRALGSSSVGLIVCSTICCDKTNSRNGKSLSSPWSTGINGYELVSFGITRLN